LTGILFFYRLSDNRFDGSSAKCLSTLRDMVGRAVLPNVGLVTTMMTKMTAEEKGCRLKQLREVYWRDFVNKGSKMYEFDGMCDTARSVLRNAEFSSGITTRMERELETLPLSETRAGRPLYSAVLRLLERIKQLLEWFEQKLGPGKDSEGAPSHVAPEDLEAWEKIPPPLSLVTDFHPGRYGITVRLGLTVIRETRNTPRSGEQRARSSNRSSICAAAGQTIILGCPTGGMGSVSSQSQRHPACRYCTDHCEEGQSKSSSLITSSSFSYTIFQDTDYLPTIVDFAQATVLYLDTCSGDLSSISPNDEPVQLEMLTRFVAYTRDRQVS